MLFFSKNKQSNGRRGPSLLGSRLVEAGLIDRSQLETALQEQKGRHEFLGQTLVRLGYLTQDDIKLFLPDSHTNEYLPQLNLEHLDSPEFVDFFRLQSQIKFALFSDKPLKTILITSALPSEGKTLCSTCLAMITAITLGKRVLLIDSDLRYPSLHRVFHLSNAFGLSDVLVDSWPVEKATRNTKLPNLRVLTTGTRPTNPSQLLSSTKMDDLLKSLGQEYDLIFLDSSPVLATPDASLLGMTASGTILVADGKRTRMKDLRRAVAKLEQANANIMGVLLNRYQGKEIENYTKDYYYYSHSKPNP